MPVLCSFVCGKIDVSFESDSLISLYRSDNLTARGGKINPDPAGARSPRHIFIGDIHGCFDELAALLAFLDPGPDDTVVSSGDIVGKGPQVERCLAFWQNRGYPAVAGNHEDELLRHTEISGVNPWPDHPHLLEYIACLPVMLDFPSIGATVVHGGLYPEQPPDPVAAENERDAILRLRWLRKTNGAWFKVKKGHEVATDKFWADLWSGERVVLYGHTPRIRSRPMLHPRAIGLDTGCVYGGWLSAAIHQNGSWQLCSVPARRSYASRSRSGSSLSRVIGRLAAALRRLLLPKRPRYRKVPASWPRMGETKGMDE